MAAKRSRNIPLQQEGSDIVETRFASSDYADAGSMIEDPGCLSKRDASVERWLIEDVAPTYDKMKSNPERGLSPDDVRMRLDARAAALREASQP